MITKRVKRLKKEFSHEAALPDGIRSLVKMQNLSDRIMEELVDKCEPTEAEFTRIADSIIVSATTLYRILTGRYKL